MSIDITVLGSSDPLEMARKVLGNKINLRIFFAGVPISQPSSALWVIKVTINKNQFCATFPEASKRFVLRDDKMHLNTVE